MSTPDAVVKAAVLWIVGEPGIGKTTLVRQLLAALGGLGYATVARPKWTVGDAIVAAGHYLGGTFDGADTVPYNAVDEALQYWHERLADQTPLTVFDGDRFSYLGVLEAIATLRPQLPQLCVQIVGPELAAARRVQRGSVQNAIWLRGRTTKSDHFAQVFLDSNLLKIEGEGRPEHIRDAVLQFLDQPHQVGVKPSPAEPKKKRKP